MKRGGAYHLLDGVNDLEHSGVVKCTGHVMVANYMASDWIDGS